jgi:hypothetical protein
MKKNHHPRFNRVIPAFAQERQVKLLIGIEDCHSEEANLVNEYMAHT